MRRSRTGPSPVVGAEDGVQQRLGARAGELVDAELGVVGLVRPGVPVARPVVDEQEHAGRGQARHQRVEEGLRLGVDPVQVLERHEERLDLALAEQEALDGFQRALAALARLQDDPLRVVHRHVEERQEGGEARLERLVEAEHLAGDLLRDLPRMVAILDLEVGPEQVDQGQVGRGPPVRDRPALQHEPAAADVRVRDLPEQARLPTPGSPTRATTCPCPLAGQLHRAVDLIHLGAAPHEPGQAARGHRLQPRAGAPGADELEDLDRRRQPLDRRRAERLRLHEALDQAQRRRRHQDRPPAARAAPSARPGAWSGPPPCSPCAGRCRWPAPRPRPS